MVWVQEVLKIPAEMNEMAFQNMTLPEQLQLMHDLNLVNYHFLNVRELYQQRLVAETLLDPPKAY